MNEEDLRERTTNLIRAAREGGKTSLAQLFEMVYADLRRIAEQRLRQERRNHTLQPTALVNEAFLKMVHQGVELEDRAYFLGVASRAMRQVLIDHARGRSRQKRGGELQRITLSGVDVLSRSDDVVDLLAFDELLEKLGKLNHRHARLLEFRFYGGMTLAEAAQALEVSLSTTESDWRMVRAWVQRELTRSSSS